MSNLNLWVRYGFTPPPGRDIDVMNGAPVTVSRRRPAATST
jgi:hypothetical protein